MTAQPFVIAITGSPSHLVAAAAASTGKLLGVVSTNRGINPLSSSIETTFTDISHVLDLLSRSVRQHTGIDIRNSSGHKLLLAIEHSGSAVRRDIISDCLERSGWWSSPQFTSKENAILHAALFQQEGILIGVGRHSFVYTNLSSQELKTGGWGLFTGYDGGAFSIGLSALATLFQMHDGRSKRDEQFESAVLSSLGAPNPESILDWLYGNSVAVSTKISALTKVIVDLNEQQNNKTAINLLWESINTISQNFSKHIQRLGKTQQATEKPFPLHIVITGGLVQHCEFVATTLRDEITRRYRGVDSLSLSYYRPIIGTIVLALDLLENGNKSERISVLKSSLQSEGLPFPINNFANNFTEPWKAQWLINR